MNTRRGRFGIALVAILVVACGDAAVGTMMEDGGGAVGDAGGGLVDLGMMLVDMGTQLMDAGQQVQDAGQAVSDLGSSMDSAVAQGPGPWTAVGCTEYESVLTTADYVLTTGRAFATFTADINTRWEVERCRVGPASASDANFDGCPDELPTGATCTTNGPFPDAVCTYGAPNRAQDGTVVEDCRYLYSIDYTNPAISDSVTDIRHTIRYRRL